MQHADDLLELAMGLLGDRYQLHGWAEARVQLISNQLRGDLRTCVATASVPDPPVLGRPPATAAAAVAGVLDADVARSVGTAGFFASSSSKLLHA